MKQCGLDGIRAPYDANNGIRDAFSTTDIIMISLCYHYDILSYFASVYDTVLDQWNGLDFFS